MPFRPSSDLVTSIVAGVALIASVVWLMTAGLSLETGGIAALCFVGWGFVAWLSWEKRRVRARVAAASKLIGLEPTSISLAKQTESFVQEFGRYHRALAGLRGDASNTAKDLGAGLRRISKQVYLELRANAVEFSLFDDVSQQWSQAMVLGTPRSVNSQAMLTAAMEAGSRQILSFENYQVLVMPVIFSGTVFGALRVEIPASVKPSSNDIELLHLYAVQGAMAVLDSRFTDELLRLRRASEETVRAKTGFLANLSHEIRGPLGIILNGVELIRDGLCGPVNEQQLSTLTMIKESGDHLLDLVNDVLDYAKVEAGKIVPKTVQIPLQPLLDDLVSVVRTQAIEKGHTL